MELVTLPKFDHSKDTLGAVMGLSDYDQHYVKTCIIFEIISTKILTEDLFEDVAEAPKDMTTVSGLLEKALRHARTPSQQLYCMLEFQVGYAHTMHGLQLIEEKSQQKASKKEGKENIGDDLKNLLGKLVDKLKTLPLESTVQEVVNCKHDFDKFIENVIPRKNYDSEGNAVGHARGGMRGGLNMDDIIRKTLGDIPGIEFMGSIEPDDDDDDE